MRAGREAKARILKLAVDGRAFHDDPVAFRLLDLEFHQALYDGAGNRLLAALAAALYDMGLDLRRSASALPGVIETSVGQHVEVAEAVVADDADRRSPPTAGTSSMCATPRCRRSRWRRRSREPR